MAALPAPASPSRLASTVGLSVDQSRTNVDVTGAAQSGRIDLTQIGAIAAYENGPWNFGATLVQGFGDVRSSRFEGRRVLCVLSWRLWAAMAEISYYWALPNNSRFVPKLTFDWTRTRTDAFAETGGATPVAGSSVTANRVRMLVGGEVGQAGCEPPIMDFAVYGRLVDNLSQNFGRCW